MKKVIIIAVLALNAVCLSYLAFSENSQTFNINSAIAEEGSAYEKIVIISDYAELESYSTDPDCGECVNITSHEIETVSCSGTGDLDCSPSSEEQICYAVFCEGGPLCLDDAWADCFSSSN